MNGLSFDVFLYSCPQANHTPSWGQTDPTGVLGAQLFPHGPVYQAADHHNQDELDQADQEGHLPSEGGGRESGGRALVHGDGEVQEPDLREYGI